VDNWLIDRAFRSHGTNFLLPDVIDTLLEFDFNHADLKFIEREAFNVKSIPRTWHKLADHLDGLVSEAESAKRDHTAFQLRQRLVLALLRSWTHGQSPDASLDHWHKINVEYDKACNYLKQYKNLRTERVLFEVDGEECHGLLRIPNHLHLDDLSVLVILPGMDMTKEYFPSLISTNFDFRSFATLALDPPGHGFSFVRGTKLTSTNYDKLLDKTKEWLFSDISHDFKVSKVGILGIGTSSVFAFRAGVRHQDLTVVAGFEGGFLFEPIKTLSDQSSMRLKKLIAMTGLDCDQVGFFLEEVSLEKFNFEPKVPLIFSVGEFDDLFLYEQIGKFVSKLKFPFSVNLFEGEGHVLGKVINESLMLTSDQIEECFSGITENLLGLNCIKKKQ
jgi:hypothetical protein